jgi:hypothetical protein
VPSRLDIEFHDLDLAINGAQPATCRRVAEAVATAAVQEAELTADVIDRALDELRRGSLPDYPVRRQLEELVCRRDEAYLDLQVDPDGSDLATTGETVDHAFKRARAATAALYAFGRSSRAVFACGSRDHRSGVRPPRGAASAFGLEQDSEGRGSLRRPTALSQPGCLN